MNEDETLIWEGSPSQWTNFGVYLACTVLCILIIPVFYAIWKWIELRCFRYEITDQRIRFHRGVFSRRTDSIELYRIKDVTFVQPFLMRLVGIGNVELTTSDDTTPHLTLRGIPGAEALREKLLQATDRIRDRKGVREMDFSQHPPRS
jgi:uncharacterized membrane protein YdbT with pleckstrin-like domain